MQAPDDFDPPIGVAETLEPSLQRIVAPNPSPMTYRGTNTYLLGEQELAVIDPGPSDTMHLQAILDAVQPGQKISHIIVTHAHLDHSPLARDLSAACGASIWGFGPAHAGRSEVMHQLAASGMVGGGEGIDAEFLPDHIVTEQDRIAGLGWELEVIHTPGHIGNHICLRWNNACLTGDHVMGWASSLVSPPDGDLTDFMISCAKLQTRDWRVFFPGHGGQIDNPKERLEWLVSHRTSRENSILEHLQTAPANAAHLAKLIYADTPPGLLGAATRNVLAHLIDLTGKSVVAPKAEMRADAVFQLI